jgi:hypothetical protein
MDDEFEGAVFEPEDDPDPPPKTRTTRTRRAAPRAPTKRIQNLKDALAKQMFQAGTVMGMAMPVTGLYVCQQADPFTEAVTRLAAKDNRYIEALEQVAALGPGITIGRTVAGVFCAVGTDRYHATGGEHGISPDKRAAMLLGVSAAYYELYGDEEENGYASSNGYAPPPGRFVPVPQG